MLDHGFGIYSKLEVKLAGVSVSEGGLESAQTFCQFWAENAAHPSTLWYLSDRSECPLEGEITRRCLDQNGKPTDKYELLSEALVAQGLAEPRG